MMTNAQAALIAATSGIQLRTDQAHLYLPVAVDFKEWLDRQDASERRRKGTPKMTRESASEHYGVPPATTQVEQGIPPARESVVRFPGVQAKDEPF